MTKILFRLTAFIHVSLYRLSKGKMGGAMRGFQVLLLTTVGRKSGKKHTNPLGYFEYDGGFVITASNAGLARNPGWYYNLKDRPQATIQVMDKLMEVRVEIAQGNLREQLWEQLIAQAPGYAAYREQTTRTIPMVILRPLQRP